jgi:diacylglycerol O-acyltransferase / wax synthase
MADRRLSPLDAAFLYFERPTQRFHVGCVTLLDGTPPFDDLVALIGERLGRLPQYRQIPVRPTLDWNLPRWEADRHYDVRRHVRHVGVPAPGDEIALARVADDLFSVPLPDDRPPWDMTLVRGLAGGRSALVMKVHHCMIDGISGAQVLEAISDREERHPARAPKEGSAGRPSTLRTLLGLLGRIDLHAVAELGATFSSFVREPVSALPFNGPLSPSRRVVWAGFDLRDFLAVRGAVGCKINDAVLAVIAGALRRYLQAHGVATDGLRVRAGVPVSVRGDQDRLTLGNLVSAVFPGLPVDVADPVERLRRVAQEMAAIKIRQQAQATGLFLGLMSSLPAPLEALLGRLMPDTAFVNTICTNVPGPRERCTLAGVPIADVHPYVPLFQSMGIEFAILSYADRLSIAAAVDPALVPDADALPSHLRDAFSELEAALRLRKPAAPPAGGAAHDGPPVAALMSSPVLTLSPDDPLERAWRLMARARVRHLPVVDDAGRLLGLVTHRDLLAASPSRVRVRDEAARLRLLASIAAREVMETHLVVTLPDEPAAVAGERMIAGKIGALPVVERSGRLVGILTTEDLVRWATERLTRAA